MDTKITKYLGIAIVAGIALSIIALFWYVSAFSKSVVPNRTFAVSGEGKVVAVPDVAELFFGVLTEGGKNLADLQKENTNKANNVIAFLKENDVDEKDIKTQSYNITPRYQYYACPSPKYGNDAATCPPSEIVGYSVNQSVLVKIRELNKAGDIVAGVVGKGANTISGPTFTVDDPTDLQNQAREEAIGKAKAKAKTIARAGGFRLGKLLALSEGISLPTPLPYESFAFAKGGDFENPSIEPGSQEIKVSVTLNYEMK